MTDFLSRYLRIKKVELPLALLGALYFFCVLCGYFFLRPVREAMGVSRGMSDLRWLFTVTSILSLVAVLAFGGVVARMNRRQFIPVAYLFVIVCLLLFSGLLIVNIMSGGGLIGSEAETLTSRLVGYTFYVWLSVINLFITSVFWAFMVDIFHFDQSKRMFPFIGIGGTLGAIMGGWSTNQVSSMTESPYLPVGLMLAGALFFGLAIVVMLTLDRMAIRLSSFYGTPMDRIAERRTGKMGGSLWEGLRAIGTSSYLLGIGAYIVLMAVSNTLIYFTQASIILENTDTLSQRVAGFAQFDMLAQIATLFTQIFITTHLIKRIGVGWTLAILPAVTMIGFTILSVWTLYGVMAIFQALHRATRYAVSRPARETLFSVVSASEKYKAKPVVDVFLYRGGDVAGAGIDSLFALLGVTLAGVATATIPLAGVWTVLSVRLSRTQAKKAAMEESHLASI